jgi:hypothetical protein
MVFNLAIGCRGCFHACDVVDFTAILRVLGLHFENPAPDGLMRAGVVG